MLITVTSLDGTTTIDVEGDTITGPLASYVTGLRERPWPVGVDRWMARPDDQPEAWWAIVAHLRGLGYEVAVTDIDDPVSLPAPDGPVY